MFDTPQDETLRKPLTVKITSTNDLSYPYFTLGMQGVSSMIQLLQIILLSLVINQTHPSVDADPGLPLRMAQVFIFVYLTFSLTGELSAMQKLKMRLYHYTSAEEGQNLIIRKVDDERTFAEQVCDLFKFEFLVMKNTLISSWTVFLFTWSETLKPGDNLLLRNKTPFLNRYLRWCGIGLEALVLTLTLVASVYVTNAQTTVIDVLFNFTGVLIVASLDEVLLAMVPKFEIPVMVPADFENTEPNFTHVNCEQGMVAYSGFVLLCTFIASTK